MRTPRQSRSTVKPVATVSPSTASAQKQPEPGRASPGVKASTVKKVPPVSAAETKPASKKAAKKAVAKKKRLPRSKLTREQTTEIFRRFADIEPEPKGELEHVNPFTLVVAVLLSAQATDAGVNKATRALFAVADTPTKMRALGEERVRDYIKSIGLFRNKAKNVILLCDRLIAEHGGVVPEDRDALEQLPGVGRKTANVVMNMAFGHPTMAVDTHVFRVANRTGMAPGKDPVEVEEGLLRVVPAEYGVHAHHWLILHGRYLCKARSPECPRCPIADLCRFKEKTPAAPVKKVAPAAKAAKTTPAKKKKAKPPA
ncbi:MAG: endonuclease III [Pseudomonadota bacterium]